MPCSTLHLRVGIQGVCLKPQRLLKPCPWGGLQPFALCHVCPQSAFAQSSPGKAAGAVFSAGPFPQLWSCAKPRGAQTPIGPVPAMHTVLKLKLPEPDC